ncbi:MAG: hypothetical protein QOG54_1859 [Actinomycetota bacterium]|nr:hypothetical protein [Actinomycetota bacterium]
MSPNAKKGLAIGGGVIALAIGAFFMLGDRDVPIIGPIKDAVDPPPATCPLSGVEPHNEALLDRPAVAVKVENASVAYPLSGLDEAEVVFEELVEGGVTRFMAIYHCTDSDKAGPVRSARAVDPAIVTPITRILSYSGQNAPVLQALEAADIVRIDEDTAQGALERIPREGLSSEHTLYAHTKELRKIGQKQFEDPPPDDLFGFGDVQDGAKPAASINIEFNASNTVRYDWSGDGWDRFQGDEPFMMESGDQVHVENVLIEEHTVNLSKTIVDVVGNPSLEIANETGSGRAVLFRDGKAIKGTWTRDDIESPAVFETKDGDRFVFAPGSIWIELVPDDQGEVKGSFSFAKK